ADPSNRLARTPHPRYRLSPMFSRGSAWLVLAILLGSWPGSAHAQATRAELLERLREEKAGALAPYQPSRLERWMLWFEETDPLAKLSPHNGFYARYGFQWRPTGSGPGMGIGFR